MFLNIFKSFVLNDQFVELQLVLSLVGKNNNSTSFDGKHANIMHNLVNSFFESLFYKRLMMFFQQPSKDDEIICNFRMRNTVTIQYNAVVKGVILLRGYLYQV